MDILKNIRGEIRCKKLKKRVPIGASKIRMGEFFSLRQTPLCGRGVRIIIIITYLVLYDFFQYEI
ncbi:hypothetical protein AMJ80_11215 [bacterium SM23_31]|nr:MAG: hypothetical protein AMJ80_11215 [bacterium SM23_31]